MRTTLLALSALSLVVLAAAAGVIILGLLVGLLALSVAREKPKTA